MYCKRELYFLFLDSLAIGLHINVQDEGAAARKLGDDNGDLGKLLH